MFFEIEKQAYHCHRQGSDEDAYHWATPTIWLAVDGIVHRHLLWGGVVYKASCGDAHQAQNGAQYV